MASAFVSEHQPRPETDHRLSLCVDLPPSTSPFPSPSSSFLPPPMPGVHEFAIKVPPGKNSRKKTMDDKENRDKDRANERDKARDSAGAKLNGAAPADPPTFAGKALQAPTSSLPVASERTADHHLIGSRSPSPPVVSVAPSTPTFSDQSTPQIPSQPSSLQMDPVQSPPPDVLSASTTPTRNSLALPPTPTLSHTNSTDYTAPSSSTSSESLSRRGSLTSNRPAPPSPSVSRRASAAASTSSNRSRSSRPPSASFSRTNSNRHSQRASQLFPLSSASPRASIAWAAAQERDADNRSPRPRMVLVQIKDFAYEPQDERHRGGGPNVPKPNRLKTLNRRLRPSTISSSSSTSSDDEDDDAEDGADDDGDAWNKLSSGFARLSMQLWGNTSTTKGASSTPEFPSTNDFERNFLDSVGAETAEDYYGAEDGYDDEDDEGGLIHHEEGPLYPGLYRAMYAFDPEGTAEMALEEDQIVRVVGRGGGVGWAIVERNYVHPGTGAGAVAEPTSPRRKSNPNGGYEAGNHALVPESYLEIYQLDEDAE
ncbi:hypothetical protein HGRIS_008933 [Hohenbuehelia grisea]|uniref:SH3 domain-containing protein n=1 Tax=Hohenbuehelia grisea TaxID=104357 RepID=A0ABR3IZR0_9AGAR